MQTEWKKRISFMLQISTKKPAGSFELPVFGEMLYKNPINIGRIGCPPDHRFGIPSIPDGLGGNDSLE